MILNLGPILEASLLPTEYMIRLVRLAYIEGVQLDTPLLSHALL